MSPILDLNTLEFFSRSAEQTRRVGMRLGELIQPGDVVCLEGDLGTGKTTLVQGISKGWGSTDPVSSPSYVLINAYRRPNGNRLYHLDAYRLDSPGEAVDLDIDILIETGPLVVEWAERIQEALPAKHLWVGLRWLDMEQRGMQIYATGNRYQNLLADFRQTIYNLPK